MPHKSIHFAGNKELTSLGRALREARKGSGLSQETLALNAEVERSYLGAIERGEVNVTLMVLARICAELRVKPSELMGRAGL
jgi:transcriptional regulator with XRE-family HTH domain